jgi:hypothetical protein
VVLGHVDDPVGHIAHRGMEEIEAESVAWVVAAALGIDASSASFGYIGSYASGETSLVRFTAERVINASRLILAELPGWEQGRDTPGIEAGLT